MIGETYAGVHGLVCCLVGSGISFGYIKSGLSCLFAYESHQSRDDGACHKCSLVGAGENIQQHIAWPSGSLLVGSIPVH